MKREESEEAAIIGEGEKGMICFKGIFKNIVINVFRR